jgi:transcription termination factor Rho
MMHPTAPLAQGILERNPKGFGFLRDPKRNFRVHPADPYVPGQFLDRYNLADGVEMAGPLEPPRRGVGPRLAAVATIEGADPALYKRRNWDELTAVDPTRRFVLETGPEPLTTRVMDMFTPIGMGQRGLLVAPPRSGKTVLLQHIAQAVATNHPDVKLIVLLIDERPEEVTEMKRNVQGDVYASSSDAETISHLKLAENIIERAKRLCESGRDVLVLLDSITRLARAYNKYSGSGKTMSGGIDSRAMEVPKRLFGSARAFEEGGTLTILGTALIETGSRMDDVIFQEFKGTGNMELVLDRTLAERRIYPAINLGASGTRKEERLLGAEPLERITLLRRSLMQLKPIEAMEGVVAQLKKTKSNAEFLEVVGKFAK